MSRIQRLQRLGLVAFLSLAVPGTGHAAEAGKLVQGFPGIQKSHMVRVPQSVPQETRSRQDEPTTKPSDGGLVAGSSGLLGATPALPGTYRLVVQVSPASNRGRPYGREIVVVGKPKLDHSPQGGFVPAPGGMAAMKRNSDHSAPATQVVGQAGSGAVVDTSPGEALPSGDASQAEVEYCSADEFGTLCCKIVQPGGDLNPHIHVKNVTGTNLPAGQDIVVLALGGPVFFELTHPLAQGQWTAGPSVNWNEVYSEQFEKAYCYAGTKIQ